LQVSGNVIRCECFHIHLHQGNEGTSKIWKLAAAAIDDRACRYDDSTMVANDLDRLLNPTSARYDILRHDEALSGADFESSPQNESSISILLNKDVSLAEMAGDFLSHNDAADCG
jgi:hypothetical protein